jgi:hypothetical protein
VWSVLGPNKVKYYQDLLVAETDRIPELGNTSYSGCFHDGNKMLSVIRKMHIEVLNAKGANDQIISELVPLVEQMLDAAEARPSADRLRELSNRALDRAMAMSTTDQSVFPRSLRTQPAPASPPVTPPKLPLRSRRRSEGLRIDGVHLPDTPLSSEHTPNHIRSSYTSSSPISAHRNKHISIETVMSDHRSIPMGDENRGTLYGGTRELGSNTASPILPSSNNPRFHSPPSSGDWGGPSQPYAHTSNGGFHGTDERPISGHQGPTIEYPASIQRNSSHRTNRRSIHSNIKHSNPPYASISQIDTWINKKKAHTATARPIPEGDLDALDNRDQVKVVAQITKTILT